MTSDEALRKLGKELAKGDKYIVYTPRDPEVEPLGDGEDIEYKWHLPKKDRKKLNRVKKELLKRFFK